MLEGFDKLGRGRLSQIGRWRGGTSFGADITHAPDAAANAVAPRMIQRNLDMADDAVVKIRDIKRPVWADFTTMPATSSTSASSTRISILIFGTSAMSYSAPR